MMLRLGTPDEEISSSDQLNWGRPWTPRSANERAVEEAVTLITGSNNLK